MFTAWYQKQLHVWIVFSFITQHNEVITILVHYSECRYTVYMSVHCTCSAFESSLLTNLCSLSLLTKYSNFCHRETNVVDGVQYVNVKSRNYWVVFRQDTSPCSDLSFLPLLLLPSYADADLYKGTVSIYMQLFHREHINSKKQLQMFLWHQGLLANC